LKERIAALGRAGTAQRPLIGDLIRPSEIVVLVIPIDKAAPKGRLILPQQMTIRGILDADGIPVCVKEDRLEELIGRLGSGENGGAGNEPGLIITDSQVFEEVSKIVPDRIPLTSFSILMARYKGFLDAAVRGVRKIDDLKDGDIVLISEGCTHHRQCGDIGTEKLPAWIRKRTGKKLLFETSSGTGFPEDLSRYAMVIHCGGCMLNEREMRFRMKCAADQGIPFTNYGTAIAYMKGILDRSLQVVWRQE
ncbi:MAG TPA: [FeFe] hydrogenase H-cluster maturation GTPase HydF, partial [Lachnospiraceae bacterium]|nr:[FeFe] hydrogenase H-cluster maturation GTPase HydF [Lachnospiraceae bacterium]